METSKSERLVARAKPEVQELIQRAADYSGATVSQFLIESAMDRARVIIEQTETLRLSKDSADALFKALGKAPKPNAKLRKAAKRYQAKVNDLNQ